MILDTTKDYDDLFDDEIKYLYDNFTKEIYDKFIKNNYSVEIVEMPNFIKMYIDSNLNLYTKKYEVVTHILNYDELLEIIDNKYYNNIVSIYSLIEENNEYRIRYVNTNIEDKFYRRKKLIGKILEDV